MSRKSMTATAIILLSFTAALPAVHASFRRPQPPPKAAPINPKSIFQGLYNTSDAAGSQKDLDGYLACYLQDFKLTDTGKKETDLEDIRYRLSSMFDDAQSVRSSTMVTSAAIKKGPTLTSADTASVMVKSTLAMRLTNPNNQQKFVIIDKIVSKDSWIKTEDGWMMQKSQIISEQNTANGHAIADKSDPFAAPKAKTTEADDSGDNNN